MDFASPYVRGLPVLPRVFSTLQLLFTAAHPAMSSAWLSVRIADAVSGASAEILAAHLAPTQYLLLS